MHDLRWNTHIRNMCTKANKTLYKCLQDVKEAAYKGLVCPVFGIWQLCLGSAR